jgi:hypothetical protein
MMVDELFERYKNISTYWFNKSSDLHGSAAAIWYSMNKKYSLKIVKTCRLGDGFDLSIACWPVYLMVSGMSLELMYKAICVAKKVTFPNTHRLSRLALLTGITFESDDINLLDYLSECIIWFGRYPIPKKMPDMQKLHQLSSKIFWKPIQIGHLKGRKPNRIFEWNHYDKMWLAGFNKYHETTTIITRNRGL